jgi:hypothetical protein
VICGLSFLNSLVHNTVERAMQRIGNGEIDDAEIDNAEIRNVDRKCGRAAL